MSEQKAARCEMKSTFDDLSVHVAEAHKAIEALKR